MWLEHPIKALCAAVGALILGGALIAFGIVILNQMVG
jgi:hypothetical protein|tara:strand:- start:142 stop:252 length:111 start_codon:yes stop_codon:yes gene_type:complete